MEPGECGCPSVSSFGVDNPLYSILPMLVALFLILCGLFKLNEPHRLQPVCCTLCMYSLLVRCSLFNSRWLFTECWMASPHHTSDQNVKRLHFLWRILCFSWLVCLWVSFCCSFCLSCWEMKTFETPLFLVCFTWLGLNEVDAWEPMQLYVWDAQTF